MTTKQQMRSDLHRAVTLIVPLILLVVASRICDEVHYMPVNFVWVAAFISTSPMVFLAGIFCGFHK
jgi:hypothetical protein